LLGSFLSAFFFYLESDLAAMALFVASWVVTPFLALRDKIIFDGKRLKRTGVIPRIWGKITKSRTTLKYSDIEQIETHAQRVIRRGGAMYYRYQTVIKGQGIEISISSGGRGFRALLESLLPLLDDDILDARTLELRDHFKEPDEVLRFADRMRIPSADVLEAAFASKRSKKGRASRIADAETFGAKTEELASLANGLRLGGFFIQSLEAFRRGLIQSPGDAKLLFDFARCLHTFASVRRDPKLQRRALAALRRSEFCAADDGELLIRVGEWYIQIGDIERATRAFTKASAKLGENFRAARGLAEIALREGKLAHVVHQFNAAHRSATTAALKRWSKKEVDYFAALSNDGEYLETEVARVKLLERILAWRRSSLRIALLGFPAILYGVLAENTFFANIGWGLSMSALLFWAGLAVAGKVFSRRIPYRVFSENAS
jgi:tetratricopeptide (TPR) repeat protein